MRFAGWLIGFYSINPCRLFNAKSCSYIYIGLMGRVFANGLRDWGSISSSSHSKWYLMPICLTLSIIRYGSRVKWSNPGNGAVPSPIPWYSSYWKGSLRVTLNYGRQLYFTYIYIYMICKWIIIIIMLCYQHGYPWPSLTTLP